MKINKLQSALRTGINNGGQPMGYHESRPALAHLSQRALDLLL
jgi:hypothetical protein